MRRFRTAMVVYFALFILAGGLYPTIVTLIGRTAFPQQAQGSLIQGKGGALVGSELIGQPFSAPGYFWSRPSATADFPYNALASGGSNLGPTNPILLRKVRARVDRLRRSGVEGPVPADLALSSGSGLDPHIDLATAMIQIPRVAEARKWSIEGVRRLVIDQLEGRQLGFLGTPRVNVVKLNLSLDRESELVGR